jgi:ribonuclease T
MLMAQRISKKPISPIARRFRGYLPVVVDVETAGFEPKRDALLEIAAVLLQINSAGLWQRAETHFCHVIPFEGANLDSQALQFTGIDPFHPFRFAVPEEQALQTIFQPIRQALKTYGCSRAILVGHNPSFDLSFIQAAGARCQIKHTPFHRFSSFDTATLGGLAYGQTVLAKAVQAAGLEWDNSQAHSAIYDAERTADLFCKIVNLWGNKIR